MPSLYLLLFSSRSVSTFSSQQMIPCQMSISASRHIIRIYTLNTLGSVWFQDHFYPFSGEGGLGGLQPNGVVSRPYLDLQRGTGREAGDLQRGVITACGYGVVTESYLHLWGWGGEVVGENRTSFEQQESKTHDKHPISAPGFPSRQKLG